MFQAPLDGKGLCVKPGKMLAFAINATGADFQPVRIQLGQRFIFPQRPYANKTGTAYSYSCLHSLPSGLHISQMYHWVRTGRPCNAGPCKMVKHGLFLGTGQGRQSAIFMQTAFYNFDSRTVVQPFRVAAWPDNGYYIITVLG